MFDGQLPCRARALRPSGVVIQDFSFRSSASTGFRTAVATIHSHDIVTILRRKWSQFMCRPYTTWFLWTAITLAIVSAAARAELTQQLNQPPEGVTALFKGDDLLCSVA